MIMGSGRVEWRGKSETSSPGLASLVTDSFRRMEPKLSVIMAAGYLGRQNPMIIACFA